MKKLIYCLTALFVSLTVAAQQSGSITGTIKTADSQPAEAVSITLRNTRLSATADEKGFYQLKNVAPGSYTLSVALIGLKSQEQAVEVRAGETTTVDFMLVENQQELEKIVVSTRAKRYHEKAPSSSLRLNTPLLEVPQNIQVVTSSAIKDQQIISTSDGLLRNVSGLVRLEHWGDMYTQVYSRGAQVQAFRNGVNVVNSYWGPLTEDMSFVDRVEFVKGPAGFMLSNGDPSGLYNVVTKKPTGITKGEVALTMGSYNLFRTSVDLDGKLSKDGRLLYRFNAAAQNKKSHRANEYNDRYAIAPVISYQLDDRTKLTFEYTYQRANMSNVGSFYVFSPSGFATLPVETTFIPGGLPGTKMNDHSFFANIQHSINNNWKLTGQLARFIYNQEGSSAWPSKVNADGTLIRGISIWDAESNMSMGQVFLNGDVTTGAVRHRILTGLDVSNKDYKADWSQGHDLDLATAPFNPMAKNSLLGVPGNGYPAFDRSLPLVQRAQAAGGLMDQSYTGFYVQDELGFLQNKVRLTLAGRYTHVSQSNWGAAADKANRLTPRVGLSVSVTPSFSAYALYDQAFTPQSGILADGGKVQPITGNNMELGLKKDWAGGRWNTTLAVYRILKYNELVADPNSAPTSGLSVELGEKRAQGVEFDLKGTIIPGLNLTANYAYTDSRVTKVTKGVTVVEEGDLVPGFAKHTANAWLTYRIRTGALRGFGVSGGVSYLGDRQTYWDPLPAQTKGLPNYTKVDAGLSWEGERLSITANVFNVFDQYLYSGSYYAWLNAYYWQTDPPRNGRISFAYRF